MERSLLIVDDDPRVRTSLARALGDETLEVRTAEDGEHALALLGESTAGVVLADLKMPSMSGLDLLRLLKRRMPDVDVVLMTAYEDLPTVAEAMREGAADFLVKPLDLHQLRRVLDRAFEDRAAREAVRWDESAPPASDRLVGRDPRMVQIFKLVGQVAATRTNVVIRGESGTGKELIAREIHTASPFATEPFVAVDCTALPSTLLESELFGHVRGAFTGATSDRRGRFAMAGRGTVFLDEIGDTAPEFQSKLLRVLQEHEYYPVGAERAKRTEARVIAATHRDLERLVAVGKFREDLYYRLRVVEIEVPPLRERMSDMPLLAEHFVAKTAAGAGGRRPVLASETIDNLTGHSWPGNVRELENCLARAAVMATGDVIRPQHVEFGAPLGESGPRLTTLEAAERDHIVRILEATRGRKSRAAEMLAISRPRLDRLIEKHGLGALIRRRGEPASDSEPDSGSDPAHR
jgi:DNA-binding NtrC family response regulator